MVLTGFLETTTRPGKGSYGVLTETKKTWTSLQINLAASETTKFYFRFQLNAFTVQWGVLWWKCLRKLCSSSESVSINENSNKSLECVFLHKAWQFSHGIFPQGSRWNEKLFYTIRFINLNGSLEDGEKCPNKIKTSMRCKNKFILCVLLWYYVTVSQSRYQITIPGLMFLTLSKS